MDQTAATGTGSGPESSAQAVHVDKDFVPQGFVMLFTSQGMPVMVPAGNADEIAGTLGLLTVKYDLQDAISAWKAMHQAKGDATIKSLEEIIAAGYARDETVWVMNEASGQERNAWLHLANALGALVPTEGQVAAAAAHLATHGHFTCDDPSCDADVPGLEKLSPLLTHYQPPSQPVDDGAPPPPPPA